MRVLDSIPAAGSPSHRQLSAVVTSDFKGKCAQRGTSMAATENSAPVTGLSASNGSTAKSTGRQSISPLRQRALGRASHFVELNSSRRTSELSESMDATRQSIKSSTDDLLRPRVQRAGLETQKESSPWHSAPLGLALLPAIGGLMFKNGSAVITDLTLLAIAAVFLNWSVRLPW